MEDEPISAGERAELERLRAEVAALTSGADRPHRRRAWRWTFGTVLLLASAVVATLATVTVFARNEVLNTDRYLQNVAPLATDPVLREAVSDRVGGAIVERLDLKAVTGNLIDSIQTKGAPDALDALAAPIASAVDSFIAKEVRALVYSDAFPELWTAVNRQAHKSINAVLNAQGGEVLGVHDGKIYLDLAPVAEAVKQRLVDRGFGIAAKLPTLSVEFPVADAAPLEQARTASVLLNAAAWVLPIVGLLLLAAGVIVVPDRRRGLLLGSAFTAAGMYLLWAALSAGRTVYLNELPDTIRSPQAAAVIYDTVLRFLLNGVQTLALLFTVVFTACWLVGPSRPARMLRRIGASVLSGLAGLIDRIGLPTTGVASFAARYRAALEIGFVAIGVLWLVLWRHPGASGVITVTLVVACASVVVELLARLGRTPRTAG